MLIFSVSITPSNPREFRYCVIFVFLSVLFILLSGFSTFCVQWCVFFRFPSSIKSSFHNVSHMACLSCVGSHSSFNALHVVILTRFFFSYCHSSVSLLQGIHEVSCYCLCGSSVNSPLSFIYWVDRQILWNL